MIYIWFVLQVAPAFIAMWIHSTKSKEIYYTKETVVKTITDFMIMAFFIIILVYGVMYYINPQEIIQLSAFTGGRFVEVGFVFKYCVLSLVASIVVGTLYSFNIRGIFKRK